jgi:hypothetical protein
MFLVNHRKWVRFSGYIITRVRSKKRGESVAFHISRRPFLARVHDLSVVLLHECETARTTISTSSAAYACASRPVPYTHHRRALLSVRRWPSTLLRFVHTHLTPTEFWYTNAILSPLFLLCTLDNNDHPPTCSPGIGEDGKQVFKLQWPNSGASPTLPQYLTYQHFAAKETWLCRHASYLWQRGSRT